MIRRERDYRDWKMIVEIEEAGEFVALDPDEILRDDGYTREPGHGQLI